MNFELRAARRAGRGGFTLVEMLIVVCIVGILAAVGVPSYQKVVHEARAAAIMTDWRTVRSAVIQYNMDRGDWPSDTRAGVVPAELEPYLGDVLFSGKGYQLDYENWSGLIGVSVVVGDPGLEAVIAKHASSSSDISFRLDHRYTFRIASKS